MNNFVGEADTIISFVHFQFEQCFRQTNTNLSIHFISKYIILSTGKNSKKNPWGLWSLLAFFCDRVYNIENSPLEETP